MPIQRRAKIATAAGVAAAALTLATGLAVAAGLPDQASDTATQHVADHDTTTTTSSTTTTVESNDALTTPEVHTNSEPQNDNDGQANRPTDTHGYEISNLAHDTAPGPDHGATVSAVAKANAQNDSHEAPDTAGTVAADEHQSATHGQSADHAPETPGSND